ncbi:phosphoesterase RecJ-like protein [Crossiella equi]|uniref:Phosphoesterase RecJ-like protein n=1 Tax=Crossiella equi TaxID=130796 RepID=A0ABS5AL73_9PSEU|nr:DHH family phosphoesterase [Crossiella equi]MBP2477171.1 phosphoesterase RecJ-like protein [Crossiella equi]
MSALVGEREAVASPGSELAAAATLLAEASDVTLLGHVNPDADALGSALALGLALHRMGKTVRVSFSTPDRAPEALVALDSAQLLVPPTAVPEVPSLLVAMDTGSLARLGWLGERVPRVIAEGGAVLVIDHHASNTRYGTHHIVDDRAESTTVLVLRLLDEMGVEVDEEIGRCLYAGLVTDTSSFRRARPQTHELAARLLAAGVDAEATARPLMDNHPFAWLGMLSTVLGGARLEPEAAQGFGLVHAVVRLRDVTGLRSEDIDSVVDVVRSTAEAEVAVVVKEIGDQEWSLSMRAVARVNVGAAAQALGGGGHRLAAGCTMRGSLEQVLAEVRAALQDAPLL